MVVTGAETADDEVGAALVAMADWLWLA